MVRLAREFMEAAPCSDIVAPSDGRSDKRILENAILQCAFVGSTSRTMSLGIHRLADRESDRRSSFSSSKTIKSYSRIDIKIALHLVLFHKHVYRSKNNSYSLKNVEIDILVAKCITNLI